MPSETGRIDIVETDLKGACYRLNKRFKLNEDRIIALEQAQSGVVGTSQSTIYDTHGNRLRKYAASANLGALFFETDRGTVYQSQYVNNAPVWAYVTGTMVAAIANQPGDLVASDKWFMFLTNDTFQQFQWSGSAWVEITQSLLAQIAYATADLTLTTAFQDVPGATITLTRAGRHLVSAAFDLSLDGAGGDAAKTLTGQLVADGTAQAPVVEMSTNGTLLGVYSQQWLYTAAATGKVLKLRAMKSAVPVGAGASKCRQTNTSISALWIGA
jgi:hypothetical protein